MATHPIEIIARGVLMKDGRLLVCRNRKHSHRFLPGGHVEFGEHAAAALEREVREEMGVALEAGAFIGATEGHFIQGSGEGRPHHEINLLFVLSDPDNTLDVERVPPTREDHILFEWLNLTTLKDPSGLGLLPASTGSIVVAWARDGDDKTSATWRSDWD